MQVLVGALLFCACHSPDEAHSSSTLRTPPPQAEPEAHSRSAGDLIVPAVPVAPSKFASRLRSFRRKSDTWVGKWEWVGPPVPSYVPIEFEGMTMKILDPSPGGHVALYRESVLGLCDHERRTCRAVARMHDTKGKIVWSVELSSFFESDALVDIWDIRYADGTLYFSSPCASPDLDDLCLSELIARAPNCGELIAVDPIRSKVLWRSAPLSSGGTFRLIGRYALSNLSARCLPTTKGQRGEQNRLVVTARDTGERKLLLDAGQADTLIRHSGGNEHLTLHYGHQTLDLTLTGFDGDSPEVTITVLPTWRP